MAGPNVELFKFGLYLFFPLAIMIHVGDPDWYERHVRPVSEERWWCGWRCKGAGMPSSRNR
jgi:protein PET100